MPPRRLVRLALPVAAVALALVTSPVQAGTSSPNDPLFVQGDQWGLSGVAASINAPAAWCVSTGAGILVGDVDSGADFGHPDLAGKLVAGARFISGNGAPDGSGQAAVQDDVGHGTMTTGLISAATNNGLGIAAVAPASRVLVVKVLKANGSGRASGSDNDIAAGIQYAVDHGARVINLSIGPEVALTGLFSGIPSAIDYAAQHGVLVAVAAGNASLPLASYQGISGEALVVGALAPDGVPAYYSNSGGGVNLYAPGGDSTQGSDVHHLVVSTNLGGGYAAEQGTSFAAPHAAGVAALLMATGMSAQAAHDRIIATAASRNGLPELDAAAALGVSPGARCGTAPVGAGGGGTVGTAPGGATAAAGTGGGRAPGAGAPGATGAPTAAPGAASASARPPGSPRAGTAPGHGTTLTQIPTRPADPPTPALAGVGALLLLGMLGAAAVAIRRRLLH